MKYVMFRMQNGSLQPVIFPDSVSHCDVKMEGGTPNSAGFVDRENGVFGHSESLKIMSLADDAAWVFATLADSTASINLLNAAEIEDEQLRRHLVMEKEKAAGPLQRSLLAPFPPVQNSEPSTLNSQPSTTL